MKDLELIRYQISLYNKTIRVIESCRTSIQLVNAIKYANLSKNRLTNPTDKSSIVLAVLVQGKKLEYIV